MPAKLPWTLTETEQDAFAAYIGEHGLPALFDSLGLDGIGNEINALLAVVVAADDHEHSDAAERVVILPVPSCPLCKALGDLDALVGGLNDWLDRYEASRG